MNNTEIIETLVRIIALTRLDDQLLKMGLTRNNVIVEKETLYRITFLVEANSKEFIGFTNLSHIQKLVMRTLREYDQLLMSDYILEVVDINYEEKEENDEYL